MYSYHQPIGEYLSRLYAYLISDLPQDGELLIYTVQLGIDYFHVGKSGQGDSSYFTMPVLMVGLLLRNDAMSNMFTRGTNLSIPRDYPDFYYWPNRNTNTASTVVPNGQSWHGYSVFY